MRLLTWIAKKLPSTPWLLRIACVLTLLGLVFMCWSMVVPTPLPIILAMSVGQGFGTIAFALYLVAIWRDVRARKDT